MNNTTNHENDNNYVFRNGTWVYDPLVVDPASGLIVRKSWLED